jgi:hypothetical protein
MAVIPLGHLKSNYHLRDILSDIGRCRTFFDEATRLSLIECFAAHISILTEARGTIDLREKLPEIAKPVFDRLYRGDVPIEKIQDDFAVVMCGNPIFKSFRGLCGGVTFAKGPRDQLVFKWTAPWEMACHRIYTVFIKIINDRAIHIPEAKDLSKSPPEVSWLAQPTPDDRTKVAPSCLILFAKAPGATLIDFIAGRYSALTPQLKDELWVGLGKIAIIDLILAHQDRLFKLDLPRLRPHDGDYGLYANLGNLIIDILDDRLDFHLIDNGSDLEDERIKYLRPFFNGEEAQYDALIEIMKNQIVEALNRANFPIKKAGEISTNITAFRTDFLLAHDRLKFGMMEMMRHIQETIPANIKLFKNIYPVLQETPQARRVMSRLVACRPDHL